MSAADAALIDIFRAFDHVWEIQFTDPGTNAATALFDGSLGQWLRDLEGLNPGKDLWHDANVRELHDFIVGYVVPMIALELRKQSPNTAVGDVVMSRVAADVMGDKTTVAYCTVVVDSLYKKIVHREDKTPICDTKIFFQ